jgi:hypothetical protein
MNLTPELGARGKHPELGLSHLVNCYRHGPRFESHGQIVRVMAKQYGEAVGPGKLTCRSCNQMSDKLFVGQVTKLTNCDDLNDSS